MCASILLLRIQTLKKKEFNSLVGSTHKNPWKEYYTTLGEVLTNVICYPKRHGVSTTFQSLNFRWIECLKKTQDLICNQTNSRL